MATAIIRYAPAIELNLELRTAFASTKRELPLVRSRPGTAHNGCRDHDVRCPFPPVESLGKRSPYFADGGRRLDRALVFDVCLCIPAIWMVG